MRISTVADNKKPPIVGTLLKVARLAPATPIACLDKRSAILLGIFPTLALELLNTFWLEPLILRGPTYFYIADLVQWIIVPGLVWAFILRASNIKPGEYGFPGPIRLPSLLSAAQALSVAFLLWLAYRPVMVIGYRWLWTYAGDIGYGTIIPKLFPWNILTSLYFSATAAVVEETVFRGLPWLYFSCFLSPARRISWYLILTPLLFAACHSEQGPHGVIAAWAYGFVAAMLYIRLRNLWPLIFGHFAIDMIEFWPNTL